MKIIFLTLIYIVIVPSLYLNKTINGSTLKKVSENPEWLGILRESIFKTISPSPSTNNKLYKKILEASFYGAFTGKASDLSNIESVTSLARGDVYYLAAKGDWILCQEGCTDCTECLLQSSPSLKWTLRRVLVQEPAFNSSRYDLQLTIVPQLDGSFHMNNLHRRSYVYTTRTKQSARRKNRANKMKKSKSVRKKSTVGKMASKRSSATSTRNYDTELMPIVSSAYGSTARVNPLSDEIGKQRRRKKQLLHVVPVDLKQDRSFGASSREVSSSEKVAESPIEYIKRIAVENSKVLGNATADNNYSRILERFSQFYGAQRNPDNESLSNDLENLQCSHKKFIEDSQLEKSKGNCIRNTNIMLVVNFLLLNNVYFVLTKKLFVLSKKICRN